MATNKPSSRTKKSSSEKTVPAAAAAPQPKPPHTGRAAAVRESEEERSPAREWVAAAEQCAREEPLKCIGIVAAIGVLTSILPIGRLVAMLIGGMFSTVRPILMVVGLVKVMEEIDRRRES